jgi:hypothetical protein
MAIVWKCARHRDFSDETPIVYVLAVERQTLVPSLSLAERERAANACFFIGLSSLWGQFFTRQCPTSVPRKSCERHKITRCCGPRPALETAAIFDHRALVKPQADTADTLGRLSMAAKATVTVGPLARGGKSRGPPIAADHDLPPEAPVTPVGLFLPALAALVLYGSTAKVTRAGRGDGLGRWWDVGPARLAPITPWVSNLEKGPEHHSRRTQGMRRIVDCAQASGGTVRLASSPPSQSQDNPSERCWGRLENHWNGARLDALEAGSRCPTTMPWQGRGPMVALVTTPSQSGVNLTQEAMQMVETPSQRCPGLDQWCVDLGPTSSSMQAT